MPSNLVLLCLGLLLGVGSTLYPRLPEVLPASLVAHLPFLDAASLAASTSSWSVYEKYQASIPIIENHDPFAEKLPPGERKMRMGSKIDKEIVGEGDFTRVETAGAENLVGMELPVYFVEQGTFHPRHESLAKRRSAVRSDGGPQLRVGPVVAAHRGRDHVARSTDDDCPPLTATVRTSALSRAYHSPQLPQIQDLGGDHQQLSSRAPPLFAHLLKSVPAAVHVRWLYRRRQHDT